METESALSSQTRVLRLVADWMRPRLLQAIVSAGIPDLLAQGPKSVQELADTTGLEADALRRVLRALSSIDVCRQQAGDYFAEGELSRVLRHDAPDSMRDYLEYAMSESNSLAWMHAHKAMETGQPAFEFANGADFWELQSHNESERNTFHRAMAALTRLRASLVCDAVDFSRFGCIADIGGGTGVLLAEILRSAPKTRGILFDRKETMPAARTYLADHGLLSRVALEGGSFFDTVPSNADAYILKSILHDWSDEDCGKILRTIHDHMPRSAVLYIVEVVMLPAAIPQPGTWFDMQMLVAVGGRERSRHEWRELLKRSSFKLTRLLPLEGPEAIMVAEPI